MKQKTLIIGTRGSLLALEQARLVQAGLKGPSDIKIVKTAGDRFQDKPLHQTDGIGFFTKEIEEELLRKDIDLAVHSLKDLPTRLAPGLTLAGTLQRDFSCDVLLVHPNALEMNLKLPLAPKARVGASSRRRQALLFTFRPDVLPLPIRGNVPTRIQKIIQGDYDAIVLSLAGLARLKLDIQPLLAFELNPTLWPGAPGQGVIAIETRKHDQATQKRLWHLNHPITFESTRIERELLTVYGSGCHAPFGAWVRIEPKQVQIILGAQLDDGRFHLKNITAQELSQAYSTAAAWARAPTEAPSPSLSEEEPWIYRPSQSWC